jgi:hypothetical protein
MVQDTQLYLINWIKRTNTPLLDNAQDSKHTIIPQLVQDIQLYLHWFKTHNYTITGSKHTIIP